MISGTQLNQRLILVSLAFNDINLLGLSERIFRFTRTWFSKYDHRVVFHDMLAPRLGEVGCSPREIDISISLAAFCIDIDALDVSVSIPHVCIVRITKTTEQSTLHRITGSRGFTSTHNTQSNLVLRVSLLFGGPS
ncbi:hypothetical protein K474DRAFT_1659707 [Panus rudis PR-1116 ss-1]|nr:hypothetical protein K474DRAFT_1659707 [Panus rudis PR-1116 ss-1]